MNCGGDLLKPEKLGTIQAFGSNAQDVPVSRSSVAPSV